MNKATLNQEILEYTWKELQLEELINIDYCKILTNIIQKSIWSPYYHVLITYNYWIRFLDLTWHSFDATKWVPDQFCHIDTIVDWCNDIIKCNQKVESL